jgi:hypothetical protein
MQEKGATMADINSLETKLTSSIQTEFKKFHDMLETLKTSKETSLALPSKPLVLRGITHDVDPELIKGKQLPLDGKRDASSSSNHQNTPSSQDEVPKGYNATTPPSQYHTPDPIIPHPQVSHRGDPPLLKDYTFSQWQYMMKSHVCSSSIELWRIIQVGYKPHDPTNLTRREVVEAQLDATALYMIQKAVGNKDMPRIQHLTTAKETWDGLSELFVGND